MNRRHHWVNQSTKCPDICTADYAPVCGKQLNSVYKTYSNMCHLNIDACNNPSKLVANHFVNSLIIIM